MADWSRAERHENGRWTVIDCRTCTSMQFSPIFDPPLMVCANEKVKGKTNDKPACEVARSPVGRCWTGGKFYAGKAKPK